MSNYSVLEEVLNTLHSLTQDEIKKVQAYFEVTQLKTHEHFQHWKQPVKQVGFITEGVARAYFIDANQKEVTKFFLHSKQFIADVYGLHKKRLAYLGFEALSPCTLLTTSVANLQTLCNEIPNLQTLLYQWYIENLLLEFQSSDVMCTRNATQRYQTFLQLYSEMTSEIPLNYVAQFLNISPQSVSRIRRQLT